MANNSNILFSACNKPQRVNQDGDFLRFQSDLSVFTSRKLFQNIFVYWIINDSVIQDKKGIIRFYITGDGIKSKPIYRKNVFETFGRMGWSLRLPQVIESFFILCSFTDGEKRLDSCYYSIINSFSRKDRKLCFSNLMEVAKKFGFPGQDHDVFFEYVDKERYKTKFGYEPDISIETNKEEKDREMFNILEMGPTTDPEAIKASYRKMVRKYHPDLSENTDNSGYTKKIKEINLAYEYLQGRFE